MKEFTYETLKELFEKGKSDDLYMTDETRELIAETLEKKAIIELEGYIRPQNTTYTFSKNIPKTLVEYLDLNGKRVKAKFYIIED